MALMVARETTINDENSSLFLRLHTVKYFSFFSSMRRVGLVSKLYFNILSSQIKQMNLLYPCCKTHTLCNKLCKFEQLKHICTELTLDSYTHDFKIKSVECLLSTSRTCLSNVLVKI